METDENKATELPVIIVEDRIYSYHTRPFQVINTLGLVRAVLTEYILVGDRGDIYQIYKTNEGSWYDIDAGNKKGDQRVLRLLKLEIDNQEIGIRF